MSPLLLIAIVTLALPVRAAAAPQVDADLVPGRLIVKLDSAAGDARAGGAARPPDGAPDGLPAALAALGARGGRRLLAPTAGSDAEARARLAAAARRAATARTRALPPAALPDLATLWVLDLPPATDPRAAAAALAADPAVVYAHPEHLGRGVVLPNDPLLACRETVCTSADPSDPAWARWQWALHRIRAPQAWERATGAGVVVAVIDSGVNRDHLDLAATAWRNRGEVADGVDNDGNGYVDDVVGWDFVTCNRFVTDGSGARTCIEENPPGGDADPRDEEGHGTAVAGILGATAGNGVDMAGVAHGAQVMAVRALNRDNRVAEADLLRAIVYAVENGARVLNMSLISPFSAAFQETIQWAHGLDVLLVAAAGNSGDDSVFYPAGFAEVVAVGSTNALDQHSSFSTFNAAVELTAPADNVLTLLGLDPGVSGVHGGISGTSMAAPQVAGLAALLWAWQPALAAADVRAALCEGAVDLGPSGRDPRFGCGRLDAVATLDRLCVADVCGDGIAEPACGEECDDGNGLAGDCCTPGCELAGIGPGCTALQPEARKCQVALASRARIFASTLHKEAQRCLDRLLKDLAAGKGAARARAACAKRLDAGDPRAALARARSRAGAQIARKCAGIEPGALGSPCDAAARSIGDVVACVLAQHATRVEKMLAIEYRDACVLVEAAGLTAQLPAVCGAP